MTFKKQGFIPDYQSTWMMFHSIKEYEESLPIDIRYTQYLNKSSCTIESFMSFAPDSPCPYYGGYVQVSRSQWNDRNYISISDNDDYIRTKTFESRELCKKEFDNLKSLCPLTTPLLKILGFID